MLPGSQNFDSGGTATLVTLRQAAGSPVRKWPCDDTEAGCGEGEPGEMRRWYLPLTVLGLASVAVLIATRCGRQMLVLLTDTFDGINPILSRNDTQRELDRLQAALNQLARSLEFVG